MKKNGFTIVELMATIIILAVITLLGVSGYNEISEKIKEKSYDSLVNYIETKAIEYASTTGDLVTNVDNLVKLGYIEADDEVGNVKSPVDGKILNCHIINIKKENDNLYGQYSDKEECDAEKILITNLNLKIHVYTTSDNTTIEEKIEPNAWSDKNVILEAYLGDKINAEEVKKIVWATSADKEEKEIHGDFYNQNKYLVEVEQIINTKYEVTIVLKDGTTYQAQTEVKIDKQKPVVYDTVIEDEYQYTSNDKKITITASDGNGSGIYGYYVGENPNCGEVKYELQESKNYEVYKDVGVYYICTKDNMGNISENISTHRIEIKLVDKVAPKCIWSGEAMYENDWTSNDRKISLSCEDNDGGSGCALNNSISKTYNFNSKTETWEYTIEDIAGNSTICKKDVKVYVDKCTEVQEKVYESGGECNKACGGGTIIRNWSQKSSFGSEFVCANGSIAQACNTEPCPSSGGESGKNCYGPDGTSSCSGMCGSSSADPGHCCVECH